MSIYTSVLTGGTNSHQTTSEEANYYATDFVSEGIVGTITSTGGVAPTTGGFAVNAQGTPDMTVAVSAGVAYVDVTPSGQAAQTLRVTNNASANVTIAANTSGSTKYDWIYLSVDAAKAANPAVDADDVATLVVSRSSSSSTDNGTPPTYGYCLAVVTVANGASSITNGNISDKRFSLTASLYPSVANVDTSETTTSTSYVSLATTSDAIPIVVGPSGILDILIYCGMSNSGSNYNNMSFALSGANTLAAGNDNSIASFGTSVDRKGAKFTKTGLTPGLTTVAAKYSVSGGTGTFVYRKITAKTY